MRHDARQRIEHVLRARGLLRETGDEPAQVKGADESLSPFLTAASAQSRLAAGPDAGRSNNPSPHPATLRGVSSSRSRS